MTTKKQKQKKRPFVLIEELYAALSYLHDIPDRKKLPHKARLPVAAACVSLMVSIGMIDGETPEEIVRNLKRIAK
jgi:hypothetical protein